MAVESLVKAGSTWTIISCRIVAISGRYTHGRACIHGMHDPAALLDTRYDEVVRVWLTSLQYICPDIFLSYLLSLLM